MVDCVTFKSGDDLPAVEIRCSNMFWVEQAESFFNFFTSSGVYSLGAGFG
jgi:hypothetical protein